MKQQGENGLAAQLVDRAVKEVPVADVAALTIALLNETATPAAAATDDDPEATVEMPALFGNDRAQAPAQHPPHSGTSPPDTLETLRQYITETVQRLDCERAEQAPQHRLAGRLRCAPS
ncbi:hypothetical protein [Streptomyces sp. NPDC054962]